MKEKAPDLIGAGLLIALGAAFALGALSGLEVIDERGRIGPGFMPFATGLMLAVFGAMVGGEAVLQHRRDPERTEAVTDEPGVVEEEEGSWATVGAVFAFTLVAILLIPVLGFIVSFGLLVFALVRFVEREGWFAAAALGVVSAILTWLVFVFFLQIPLPMGFFGAGG